MSVSSVKVRATFSAARAIHQGHHVRVTVPQHAADQQARSDIRHAEEVAALEVAERLHRERLGILNGWIRKHLLVASDEVLFSLDVHLVDVRLVLRIGEHRRALQRRRRTRFHVERKCPSQSR